MPATLLQQVAAGDPDAVRECVSRYSGLVWSLARRFCPGSEAEDAAQEIFISLWRSAAKFDPAVASEPTFVSMIARRRLIDRARARQRRPDPAPLVEGNAGSVPAPAADIADDSARAAQALLSLSPEQQRVLRLAIHEGLSHEQIAVATGMPLGTVKTNIRRGLIRVRELLTGRAPREVAT